MNNTIYEIRARTNLLRYDRVDDLFLEIEKRFLANPTACVILDLADVHMAGTSFLNALIKLNHKFPVQFSDMRLVNVAKDIRDLLAVCGLSRFVSVCTEMNKNKVA